MKKLLLGKRISLLVSDMAGSTINERGIIYRSIHKVMDQLGFPATKQEIKTWHGRDKSEVMREHLGNDQYLLQRAEKMLINDLNEEYFISNQISLIDPTLKAYFLNLRRNGIKIALNTGYPREFQNKIIHHFEMNTYIDTWISSEMVSYGRPYPFMIHKLMEECCIADVREVGKVGDTANDMKEGKNAGCGLVVGVLSGAASKEELLQSGADIVLDNITQIELS